MNPKSFALFLLLFCCLSIGQAQTNMPSQIKITAHNLSEDMSILSTKNDEVIFQIYEWQPGHHLEEPLMELDLLFDEENRVKDISLDQLQIKEETSYLLLLIEYDYERPRVQRNPVIRIHHEAIIDLYAKNKRIDISRYLGKDDLLGLQQLKGGDLTIGKVILFEGVQNLERFKYELSLE